MEEDKILSYIFDAGLTESNDSILTKIGKNNDQTGDLTLYYTDYWIFWAVYMIPNDSGIPKSILILNSNGEEITDIDTISYLQNIDPVIRDFKIKNKLSTKLVKDDQRLDSVDEIFEVQGRK